MTFSYDATNSIGQVRLLALDTDEAHARYSDEELQAFLAMSDQTVKLAAASVLDNTALRQALVLKVIAVLDLKTDGAATAKALQSLAGELRRQVREEDGDMFAIAELVLDDFSWRARVLNQFQREA